MSEVGVWWHEAVSRLDRSHKDQHASVPLDRLLGKDFVETRKVEMAFTCFRELVVLNGSRAGELMARLVIPLPVSKTLNTSYPTLERLQAEASRFEPPSVYLSRRNYLMFQNDFEEYRVPIDVDSSPSTGDLVSSYSCYRDPIARARSWEYYRAVWVDHYPPELRLASV